MVIVTPWGILNFYCLCSSRLHVTLVDLFVQQTSINYGYLNQIFQLSGSTACIAELLNVRSGVVIHVILIVSCHYAFHYELTFYSCNAYIISCLEKTAASRLVDSLLPINYLNTLHIRLTQPCPNPTKPRLRWEGSERSCQ